MTSVRLIRPAVEYEASYRRAIADFGHGRLVPYTLNYPNEESEEHIQEEDDIVQRYWIDVPAGPAERGL